MDRDSKLTVPEIAAIACVSYRTIDDRIRRHRIQATERVGAIRRYDRAAVARIIELLAASAAKREKREAAHGR